MKSSLYAIAAACLFLAVLALVDWNDSRFDYPAPVITYVTPEQVAVLSKMQMPVRGGN